MSVRGAQQVIQQAVSSWSEVTTHRHRFGGTEYRLGKRELGHIHGDRLVDIPFPKRIRDELVATSRVRPHHVLPDSGWVSLFLASPSDVELAIELFRMSYELARKRRPGASAEPVSSGVRNNR